MRLINADNLEFCGIGIFDHDGEPMMRMEDVRESINNAPTIDAVPVVRCRECIHYDMGVCLKIYDDGDASSYAWQKRESDDFCSYGERKEGAK